MDNERQQGDGMNEEMRVELLDYIQKSHEVARMLDVDIDDARHALRMYEIRHNPVIQKVDALMDALMAGFANTAGIWKRKGEGNTK